VSAPPPTRLAMLRPSRLVQFREPNRPITAAGLLQGRKPISLLRTEKPTEIARPSRGAACSQNSFGSRLCFSLDIAFYRTFRLGNFSGAWLSASSLHLTNEHTSQRHQSEPR
jgi:hypothetical protein